MNADAPLAEFEFRSGALRGSTLTLYPNRLVHRGGDESESVPLAHLAAVRIAFAREPAKLGWAIALVALALVLAALAGPLQGFAAAAAAEVATHARPQSPGGGVSALLLESFRVLGAAAALLPALAAALAACAAALGALYGLGVTTLTLTLAAVERAFPVRGRSRPLFDFAEDLSRELARIARA
jgi:hypothetical protein